MIVIQQEIAIIQYSNMSVSADSVKVNLMEQRKLL